MIQSMSCMIFSWGDFPEHAGFFGAGGGGKMIDFSLERAQGEESKRGRFFSLRMKTKFFDRTHGHRRKKIREMPHQSFVEGPAAAYDDFGNGFGKKSPGGVMNRVRRKIGERCDEVFSAFFPQELGNK